MASPFVKVSKLVKQYNGRKAVNGISFEIPKGIIFGLLGPNGAGKSTTVSLLSGLFPPDSGEIIVGGYNVLREPIKAKGLMGIVPQEIALYPSLTARENLMFWGRLYRLPSKTLRRTVAETLETVGLAARADERIEKYSGGMKRRINIAAGLLHNPDLLILDEPTVGVDPQSRRSILDTIKKLNRIGMTVIFSSHYMEEVEELCQFITIMDMGKIIAAGSFPELIRLIGESTLLKLETNKALKNLDRIKTVPAVTAVSCTETTIIATVTDSNKALSPLFAAVTGEGLQITAINVEKPNLETVFLQLTGRKLRN